MEKILIPTKKNKEIVDLTDRIDQVLKKKGWKSGVCSLFATHATCCLTTGEIGEGTAEDFLEIAWEVIPKISFRHAHNPSHAPAHMASSLIGHSLTIPVKDSLLVLGTWQRIMLVELDGPRERRVIVSFFENEK